MNTLSANTLILALAVLLTLGSVAIQFVDTGSPAAMAFPVRP
ncbi:hypothetical protein [Ancylobacter crimeensis]|nr:hypothetical protein [Ancylobacter crimeensis]